MKKIVCVAACLALAACGGTVADAPEEAVVEDNTSVAIAADGLPTPGTYTVTNSEGAVSTEVLNEDGTFTSTNADGEPVTGVWEQRSPNEFCTQVEGDEAMKCYAEEVNEDGVWTSTDPDDGEVSTVERVVEEAASEETGEEAAE